MNIEHKQLFEDIYTILVGFGASERERQGFIQTFTKPGDHTPYEWRFCGVFGFGGKFRYSDCSGQSCPFYVDYYYENRCDALDAQQTAARKLIKDCYDNYVANYLEQASAKWNPEH